MTASIIVSVIDNKTIIVDNVPLPKSKTTKRYEARRQKVFRAFCRAYVALYIIEPDRYTMNGDIMVIWRDKQKLESGSERRIEQLTRMMRDRLKDR